MLGIVAVSNHTFPIAATPVHWIDERDTSRSVSWGGGSAARAVAGLVLLGAALYPIRAFLADTSIFWWPKIAWIAALLVGALRPAWGAWLLVGCVPLVPILPYTYSGVPHGVVHLAVLSQALPLLLRVARGRTRSDADPICNGLMLLVAIGVASVSAFYFGYRLAFPSTLAFTRELHGHLSHYVFWRPGKDVENTIVALSTFADGLLAYLVVRHAAAHGSARLTVHVVAATAFAVGSIGIVQAWSGKGLRFMWTVYDPGIVRINASYSDPNALAAYFALVLPLLCAVALAAPVRMRRAWLAAIAVPIVALVMTGGRMGYLATFIGMAVVGGGAAWHVLRNSTSSEIRRRVKRLIVFALVMLVTVVCTLVVLGTAWDVRHKDQSSYLHTLLYSLNLHAPLDETLKGRITIWRTAILMIEDHPVFGIGLGRIYRRFGSYNRFIGGFETFGLSAHSTFLNIGAELGFVGLAAWIGLLWLVYASAFRELFSWQSSLNHDGGRIDWLRLGLAAGLVAFGVAMLTGDRTILREDVVMFAVVAALASTLAPQSRFAYGLVRKVVLAGLIVLAVTWPGRAELQASEVDLIRITWGFHAPEVDPGQQPFRWTTDRAIFHMPGDAEILVLPLRSLAPLPQTVRILLDGVLADELLLDDHTWRITRYTLNRDRVSPRYHRVELRVSPVWQPSADTRHLGVMVGQYRWTP